MDIITGITTAISTLKTGYEIKKLAGNLDSEVQQSDLRVEIRKLQESLIDVQDVLLNAKSEILQNREIIQEKNKRIAELEDLAKFQRTLVFKDSMYFESDENGNPVNNPYCSNCWESEKKAIHLNNRKDFFECPCCKNRFINPNRPKKERPQLKITHPGISRFSRR